VRAFLGLLGYYISAIKENAAIRRPFTQMTKKDTNFEWAEPQQLTSDDLKSALISESVLGHLRLDLFLY